MYNSKRETIGYVYEESSCILQEFNLLINGSITKHDDNDWSFDPINKHQGKQWKK